MKLLAGIVIGVLAGLSAGGVLAVSTDSLHLSSHHSRPTPSPSPPSRLVEPIVIPPEPKPTNHHDVVLRGYNALLRDVDAYQEGPSDSSRSLNLTKRLDTLERTVTDEEAHGQVEHPVQEASLNLSHSVRVYIESVDRCLAPHDSGTDPCAVVASRRQDAYSAMADLTRVYQ